MVVILLLWLEFGKHKNRQVQTQWAVKELNREICFPPTYKALSPFINHVESNLESNRGKQIFQPDLFPTESDFSVSVECQQYKPQEKLYKRPILFPFYFQNLPVRPLCSMYQMQQQELKAYNLLANGNNSPLDFNTLIIYNSAKVNIISSYVYSLRGQGIAPVSCWQRSFCF